MLLLSWTLTLTGFILVVLSASASFLAPPSPCRGARRGPAAAALFFQTLEQSYHLSCCFSRSLQDGLSAGQQRELQVNKKLM